MISFKSNNYAYLLLLLLIPVLTSCSGLESELSGTTWRMIKAGENKVTGERAQLTFNFQSDGTLIARSGDYYDEQGQWKISKNGKNIETTFIKESGASLSSVFTNVKVDGDLLYLTDKHDIQLVFKRE